MNVFDNSYTVNYETRTLECYVSLRKKFTSIITPINLPFEDNH